MTNAPFARHRGLPRHRVAQPLRRGDRRRRRRPRTCCAALRTMSRDNARTPMQWDASAHAGFTTGTPWLAVNPNHAEINAEAARADPDSVLPPLPPADRAAPHRARRRPRRLHDAAARRRARLRVHPPPRRRRAVRPGQLLQRGRRPRRRRPGGPRASCSSATTTRRRRPRSTARCGRGRRASTSGPPDPVQNVHAMRPEVRAEYERVRGRIDGDAAFGVRFERFFTELRDPLVALYGDGPALPGAVDGAARRDRADRGASRDRRSCARSTTSARSRPTGCTASRRSATSPTSTASPARCRASASGCRYLRELGVTYLHLMPLLQARPAPNDGGYAVADYGAVEPALGTMDDLRALAADLRARGHGAVRRRRPQPHRARARVGAGGDRGRRSAMLAFYRTFPDRTEPDAYERTLPEVFPDIAPGNFTWVPELDRWVWTTFNAYQWDLDYTNPEVFVAMAEVVLGLAAAGVDVLRLDAVPFLWKRHGTNCQNQPEVHDLLQALRAVDADRRAGRRVQGRGDRRRRATSSRYLGAGRHEGKECDLAYHNVLMVLLWSALASGRGRAPDPHAAGDAARAARRGLGHLRALPRRHRLGDHRGGRGGGRRGRVPAPPVPGRLLRRRLPGLVRPRRALPVEPRTGDARTSGTAASLCRPRGGARERRRDRGRPRGAPRCSCSTRSRSPTAGCR